MLIIVNYPCAKATGASPYAAISQKATTDAIEAIKEMINTNLSAEQISCDGYGIGDFDNLSQVICWLRDNKVSTVSGKGLSKNDYTDADKAKLDSVQDGANKTNVVNALNSTSTTDALSAVQGKTLNDGKANIASPALTGTPTAPTAAQTVNNTQLATTAYVRTAVDKWRVYISPGELGLTSNATIAQISAAMPSNSEFHFYFAGSAPSSIYPASYGILHIWKFAYGTAEVNYITTGMSGYWKGCVYNDNGVWTGWYKVTTTKI